ncbi:MAG: minor capsid protein [bacterium]
MRLLPGQELAHTDYAELLKAVDRLLFEIVYSPIVDLVRPTMPSSLRGEISPRALQEATARELHNAGEDALRKALRDGAVQAIPDHTGKEALFKVAKPNRHITDALKAFGCRLNKTTDLWSCPRSSVPTWVKVEAEGYAIKARAAHEAVKGLIDDLGEKVDRLVDDANLAKAADHAISEVAAGWKRGAKALEVGVGQDLGPAGEQALSAAFVRTRGIPIKSRGRVAMVAAVELSTKREVKVWAAEALARLRAEVDENAKQGYRAEGLAERIRNEYGVSKSRSELIARQETNNFMANYRQARAADAGLKRYQWYCVRDSKTRKDHLDLHGRIFYYSNPPITDTRTGSRNNPGQDFRCRCNDRPVIE